MKTLTHIPQQLDITDQFLACYDAEGHETGKWVMKNELVAGVGGNHFIFRDTKTKAGLSGWHDRKDDLCNTAMKNGFTVLSFGSQAELDAWLKEGK